MPEFSPLVLLLLIFGISWLRKRIQLIKRMTAEQARPAGQQPLQPPAPFREAAPAVMKRPSPEKTTAAKQAPDPFRMGKPAQKPEPMDSQEGRQLTEETSWNEGTERRNQPGITQSPQRPRPAILPVFGRNALVQAVVTKEILTRPRSAWRSYRS